MKVSTNVRRLIAVVLLSIMISGCSKSPYQYRTSSEFYTFMQECSMTTEDITELYDRAFVDAVVMAEDTEKGYRIDYYDLPTESQTKEAYYKNVDTALQTLAGTYYQNDTRKTRQFTLYGEESFIHIVQIRDTFIYISAPIEYKEEIADMMKGFGYPLL